MKNKRLKNLFVRGGKGALIVLAMAPLVACSEEELKPYTRINSNENFVYLVILLFVFMVPLAIEAFNENNKRNNQR